MLKKLKLRLSRHLQAAASSFNALCSKPLATMITVIVIAIALTLPSLFWVFTENFRQLTDTWQRNGQISLYLKMPLTTEQQSKMLANVRRIDGVGQAVLKTPEQGIKEMEQQEGMHDMMRYLPENPLPAVITVVPALSIASTDQLQALYNRLKVLPNVEQARLDMEWISRLNAMIETASGITNALMVLLALAVVLIIGNTLRLSIHNRHEEIRVLKLIGAPDEFIVRPFLYSGVWYGLLGAIFAVLFTNILMLSIAVAVQDLASAYHMRYPLKGLTATQACFLVVFAVVLGWLAAKFSVRRQLSFIEPSF